MLMKREFRDFIRVLKNDNKAQPGRYMSPRKEANFCASVEDYAGKDMLNVQVYEKQ